MIKQFPHSTGRRSHVAGIALAQRVFQLATDVVLVLQLFCGGLNFGIPW
ncbi:MAG: hypothetical protein OXG08_00240 [Gammaproteobacteria bacterium]|nr:hypothetical protein [Gammaproteobacteria bacterium]